MTDRQVHINAVGQVQCADWYHRDGSGSDIRLPIEEGRQPRFMRAKRPGIGVSLRRVGRWLLGLVALFLVSGMALTLPLRWINPQTTSFILQDDKRKEHQLSVWTDFDEIGDNLLLAAVAAEDQRFDQHLGLDIQSIRDSIEDSRRGDRLRGASTLTQQLAKNLYLWSGRSFLRKGLEAWLAVNLEVFLPKRRILVLYLNVVEFGPGIYGVSEAAHHFFDREPAFLDEREAAMLAAVLPSPRRYKADEPTTYLLERQDWIRLQMARLKREQWLYTIRR